MAEDIEKAVQAAIKRWQEKNGWEPDYSVVEGFCIAVNEQYIELQAENERLREGIPYRLRSSKKNMRWLLNKKGRLLAQQGDVIQRLKASGEQLYDALRAVQQAIYNGEDENDEQIEKALQAWEKKYLETKDS